MYHPKTFTIPEITGISNNQISVHLSLYEGYVKHVNLLESELTKLAASGDEHAYTVAELRRRLGFEWNGMRLHELYFEQLDGGMNMLSGDTTLYAALSKQFGSFDRWLDAFTKLSARGPGWTVLAYDASAKLFHHVWVADHEIGQLAGATIILAVDHWEHAYMVDYVPAKKGDYVSAYFAALNWTPVAKRFDAVHA